VKNTLEFFGPREVRWIRRAYETKRYARMDDWTPAAGVLMASTVATIIATFVAFCLGYGESGEHWDQWPTFIWFVWTAYVTMVVSYPIGFRTSIYHPYRAVGNENNAKIMAIRYFRALPSEYQASMGGMNFFLKTLEDFDYNETYRVNKKMGEILQREENEAKALNEARRKNRSQYDHIIRELNGIADEQGNRAQIYKEIGR
jgi:hypothetical protein